MGEDARLCAYQIDDDIAGRNVTLAAALDLPFASVSPHRRAAGLAATARGWPYCDAC